MHFVTSHPYNAPTFRAKALQAGKTTLAVTYIVFLALMATHSVTGAMSTNGIDSRSNKLELKSSRNYLTN